MHHPSAALDHASTDHAPDDASPHDELMHHPLHHDELMHDPMHHPPEHDPMPQPRMGPPRGGCNEGIPYILEETPPIPAPHLEGYPQIGVPKLGPESIVTLELQTAVNVI